MESFFDSKGKLKVVLAKGILSTYEINGLKKGGYVHFNDRDCGDLFSLYFNNVLVGYGTIVILSHIEEVGFKLSRMLWEPGLTNNLILSRDNEILETELILGEREISFKEISNLASGGVVSINTINGIVKDKPTLGVVRAAGIDLAQGNISINVDKWCLEVVNTMVKKETGIIRRDSYLNLDSNYKYYNFYMPDCLTRNQLNSIKKVHQFYAKYIGGEVISVDQLIWKELKDHHGMDLKFYLYKKEEHSAKKIGTDLTYFIPLGKSKDNKNIEDWFQERSLKEEFNQLMERVAIVQSKDNSNDFFTNENNRAIDLLESSWRNVSFLNFGELTIGKMEINCDDFIDDYDMIIVACMKKDDEYFTIVYPHKYLVQIFDELK